MSRKRADGEGDSGDVLNASALGLSDLSPRYQPPRSEGEPGWKLPDNAEIVDDFERCGSQLDIFLKAVLPEGDRFGRQLLLSAILLRLKSDREQYERFCDLRDAGEEARIMLLEEQAYTLAQYDPAAFKFILEKRKSEKYGKPKGEEGDDAQTQALKALTEALKG
jgi:hypothetical protein